MKLNHEETVRVIDGCLIFFVKSELNIEDERRYCFGRQGKNDYDNVPKREGKD